MTEGISNFQIEEAFKNRKDEDINNKLVGIFPWNYINKFIDQKGKYPLANTDSSSKSGTHWCSILDIEPKTGIFFFDSFGLDGLKTFIIQDDKKVIEKILFGTEQMTRTGNKIALVNIRFNLNACRNFSKKELDALIDTASNFFHFIQFLATSSNFVIL